MFVFISFNIKAENYAVLISIGKATTDDLFNNSEYWYDTYLAYEDLIIKEGFTHENILVFYGNGNDFTSTKYNRYKIGYNGWSNQITDYDYSFSTLTTQLNALAGKMTSSDNLLIRMIVGHGGNTTKDDYATYDQNHTLHATETQWINLFSTFENYNTMKILWMTCKCGCLITGNKAFNFPKSVTLTSSDWNENSFPMFVDNKPHAEFNYVVTSSLLGKEPYGAQYDADENNDGIISFYELYLETRTSSYMNSNSKLKDDCSISNRTYINEHLVLNNIVLNGKILYAANTLEFNNVKISSDADVSIAVQKSVTINNGTSIVSGSKFHAYISNESCSGSLKSKSIEVIDSKTNSTQEREFEYIIEEISIDKPKQKFDLSKNFNVYPNPTLSFLHIQSNDKETSIVSVELIDSKGCILLNKDFNSKECTINLQNLSSGIYFIKIYTGNYSVTKKILKK